MGPLTMESLTVESQTMGGHPLEVVAEADYELTAMQMKALE